MINNFPVLSMIYANLGIVHFAAVGLVMLSDEQVDLVGRLVDESNALDKQMKEWVRRDSLPRVRWMDEAAKIGAAQFDREYHAIRASMARVEAEAIKVLAALVTISEERMSILRTYDCVGLDKSRLRIREELRLKGIINW